MVYRGTENFTDLGLIGMFLFNLNAEIVACMLSENRATSKIWKIFPNMVFSPDLGEKKWRRSEYALASYPGLFFRTRVQPLYGAGRKESSGTGLISYKDIKSNIVVELPMTSQVAAKITFIN